MVCAGAGVNVFRKLVLFFALALVAQVHAQSGLIPQNQVWAGPSSGGPGYARGRGLVNADLPQMPATTVQCNSTNGTANAAACNAFSVTQSGDTTTFLTPPPSFGGNWFSSYNLSTNYTSTHADSRTTLNVSRTSTGSGTTGPATADYGAFITSQKLNFLSSSVEGEVDGLFAITAQGNKGDTAAILTQAQKVRGGTGATGGALGAEQSAVWTDASGNQLMNVHALSGFAEGAGGQSSNTGYGLYVESLGATPSVAASTVQPFAAYYGGAFDLNSNCPAHCPIYSNLLVGAGSRSASHIFFNVGEGINETGDIQVGSGSATGMDGNPTQSGGLRWTMKNVNGAWELFNNSNSVVAFITPNGALTAAAGTIGSSGGATAVFNVVNSHNTAGDGAAIIAAGPTSTTDTTSSYFAFEDGAQSTIYGSVHRNNNGVVYNTTSDVRLKHDLGSGSRGLADLMRVQVHDFTFKNDPSATVVEGFFAQQLATVYPEAVSVGGDDPQTNPWQIDYGRITPLLVKSIQDLQAKIQDMQHEINDLRASRH